MPLRAPRCPGWTFPPRRASLPAAAGIRTQSAPPDPASPRSQFEILDSKERNRYITFIAKHMRYRPIDQPTDRPTDTASYSGALVVRFKIFRLAFNLTIPKINKKISFHFNLCHTIQPSYIQHLADGPNERPLLFAICLYL